MNVLFGIVVIIISILNIAIPEEMAMFGERWKYRNAEPSDMNIFMTRLGGVIGIIVGIVIMFMGG
ncbi:DUF6199 family natural product biosynthesis protein [Vallitalea okinawensis]|uniref:DUF6199 family natural product biosynthesis protein n=1 Tax=Vallitalea okinawensis TaxID=2078660 RepID=UPI000CFBF6A2|nr:DUF6199 family natural product biosynthesis protein [Vallitalea okinawensis]